MGSQSRTGIPGGNAPTPRPTRPPPPVTFESRPEPLDPVEDVGRSPDQRAPGRTLPTGRVPDLVQAPRTWPREDRPPPDALPQSGPPSTPARPVPDSARPWRPPRFEHAPNAGPGGGRGPFRPSTSSEHVAPADPAARTSTLGRPVEAVPPDPPRPGHLREPPDNAGEPGGSRPRKRRDAGRPRPTPRRHAPPTFQSERCEDGT